MNNEEKNLQNTSVSEENVEIKADEKKALPTGALIGIIAGAVVVVAAIVVAVILLAGGEKCDHVDVNDDYLCDSCGEHFDDGEENNTPVNGTKEINFIVKLEDGTPLSGVKFTISRGDIVYNLVSGADGSVKQLLTVGTAEKAVTYSVDVDYETLPESCAPDLYGIATKPDTEEIVITIIDNRPDGSAEKPYPILDTDTEITLEPGQELYFNYRGASVNFLTINSDQLEITYKGETYSAVDGAINITLTPESIGAMTIFTVKNISDSAISTLMQIYAPVGSFENPIELEGSSATASVPYESIVYYTYTAENGGVLVLASPTVGNSITITRYMTKVIDGETIEIPVVAATNGDPETYIYVKQDERIIIAVSADFTSVEENAAAEVEFGLDICPATEADPMELSAGMFLSLEAGASAVFSATEEKSVVISVSGTLSISHNGAAVQPGANGKYSITLNASDVITSANNSEESASFSVNN